VGRNPRFKWVEDFSEEKTHIAEEAQAAPPIQPAKKGTGSRAALPPTPSLAARPPPSLVRPQAQEESTRVYVPKARPEIPLPPPTDESMPAAGDGRRLLTEERNLLAMARRRHQALGVALAIAIVGLFAFSLAVWQFGGPPPKEPPDKPVVAPDPRASAISGAVNQYGVPPPQPPPEPPKPTVTVPEEREETADNPQPEPNSAFVTLRTNIPARVLIDGAPIRQRTPLTKYPVKPGSRSFVLEAQGSKEKLEFTRRFEPGQHRTIDQKFESTPRR
jgi:serine/threonine-protein kinase